MENIRFEISPVVTDEALNVLFSAAWDGHSARAFQPILARSLLYVCAYSDDRLIGFVNLAWDGGVHAFLLIRRCIRITGGAESGRNWCGVR